MKKKIAFLTSGNGQDAIALTEFLLSKNYDIHSMVRRHSVAETQDIRIAHLSDKVHTYFSDLSDANSIERLFREIQPDEIYHLAAMSHVKVSWDCPSYTLQTNGLGTLNVLEAFKNNCPNARLYFAASSECFGLSVEEGNYQDENTVMNPTSIYGCSKVLGFNLSRHYRRAYRLFISCGILNNHTGIHRSRAFMEAKVVDAAVKIKLGLQGKLELGNMDTYRDFGASKDYVRAMWQMLQHHEPDDFVISMDTAHSTRDICDYVFKQLDLDYKDYVVQNPKFFRNEELPFLRGRSTKARTILGWKPEYTFESLFKEMIDERMAFYSK